MIIVSSYKFDGNIIERNICRMNAIHEMKQNDDKLKSILNKFIISYEEQNDGELKSILLNDLFFEEVDEYILNKYIKKLYKSKLKIKINVALEVYKRFGERGFVYNVDKLIKESQ